MSQAAYLIEGASPGALKPIDGDFSRQAEQGLSRLVRFGLAALLKVRDQALHEGLTEISHVGEAA